MKHDKNVALVRNHLLRAGTAGGNARLPTERALSESLGVSRGVVRSALAVLEAEGRILRKVGNGTYLAEPADGATHAPDVNPRQIVEARFAFEPQVAGVAAMNCTKQDLERLAECARQYHAADNFDAFELADGDFHMAIAEATHNPVLVQAYQAFSAAHAAAEWGNLRQRFLTAERRVASRREHDKILSAIRDRDASAAAGAVREHLHFIASAFLQP